MKKKLAIFLIAAGAFCAIVVIFNPHLLMIPMALSGRYTGVRGDTPFPEAHERAIRSFVASQGFGISRMRRMDYWNEHSIVLEGSRYVPWEIKLVGLTAEKGFRYFESSHPPLKREIGIAAHRQLSEAESTAVDEIKLRDSPLVKVPFAGKDHERGAIRVMAPIRASQKCLECHRGKAGDLLGAFDYLLIPEEHKP